MAEQDWLAGQFEQNREHLQAVAYSMLGTVSEAQDAVQEAWLRLDRSDPGAIGDLRGWLTTVVGRISLDMLRARKARREVYPGSWLPEPLVDDGAADGPEHEAVLADTVGMALLVVLETLSPAERLSFVLHDVFAVPFDDVARIMDRTPDSARQLASRARRRVQAAPQPDRDVTRQRKVVEAFLAAARGATSRPCCGCSTPTWSSGWTSARPARSLTGRSSGPTQSPARSWPPHRGSCTWPSRYW